MKCSIEIGGVYRTPAGEHWDWGLMDIAITAAAGAMEEDGGALPTGVVVGNAFGAALGDQRNLATYLASALGLSGSDTLTVSCDEASGGAAIRQAVMMIASGAHERVLVVGVEKTSDVLPDVLESVRANGLDVSREAGIGIGMNAASAMGMRHYLDTHALDRRDFYHLAATAHAWAKDNPLAMFAWPLSEHQYRKSPVVAAPLTVCDNAPMCDGGAAVMLQRDAGTPGAVRIAASTGVSDNTGIADIVTSLQLPAAATSAAAALADATVDAKDVGVWELHDSCAFMAALSIEAVGLAPKGGALVRARSGAFLPGGATRLWSFGGHKARGNAPGASGVYQLVEAALRLKEGPAKAADAQAALVQCMGGFGSQAITHILKRSPSCR